MFDLPRDDVSGGQVVGLGGGHPARDVGVDVLTHGLPQQRRKQKCRGDRLSFRNPRVGVFQRFFYHAVGDKGVVVLQARMGFGKQLFEHTVALQKPVGFQRAALHE